MTNKVKVTVCGKDLLLQTSQQPAYVTGLARSLEKRILEITTSSSSATQLTAAIMVALTAMDDINDVTHQLELLREQSKQCIDESGKFRLERDAAITEIQLLKDRIAALEQELVQQQKKAGNA